MGKKVSIKVNYIYNVLYQLAAVIVPLITTPYVSRVLNADGIGIYSYTLSIVTYFSMFATLGVAVYGQLQIAKNRDNKEERSKLFWEIFIARCTTTVFILVIYGVFICLNAQYKTMYIVLSLNILGAMMDISWYLQGLEFFKQTALRNMFVKILGAVCIFIFVNSKDDLILYAFILQGSYFLGNIFLWSYLKKSVVRVPFCKLQIYKHWKNSIVYFIPSFATSVYTVLDKSMIGWLTRSQFQNGYYEQAHKIEQMLIAIVTSMGTVTMPRVAYLLNENKKEDAKQIIRSANNFVVFLATPMMFGLFIVSSYLIPWFLGDGYDECIALLRIFSVLMLIVGLDNTIGKQCLMAADKQRQFNRGVILGAMVNALVNLILIPKFGATGAAIASVTAEFVILSMFIYFGKDLLSIKSMILNILKYSVFSLIMSICAMIGASKFANSNFQGIIIEIIIAVVVYLLLLVITKDSMIKYSLNLLRRKSSHRRK